MGLISALYIYPVKSMGGFETSTAQFDSFGLSGDRRFMLVDESGCMITQRTYPQLALFSASYTAQGLQISNADGSVIQVEINANRGTLIEVNIWRDKITAQELDTGVSQWLSDQLGVGCYLVRFADNATRNKVGKRNQEYATYFADGYPFLLANLPSLRSLETILGQRDMLRFRPNIVVSGFEAFEENQWSQDNSRLLKIGEHIFVPDKLCERCLVVNIDPSNGTSEPSTLKALAQINRVDGCVIFGQNLCTSASGMISVADKVTIVDSDIDT